MSYCSEKKTRLWKTMQAIWHTEISEKCDWNTLYKYDFKDGAEWSFKDYEQSPLCQIIWGEIISNYLGDKNKNKNYEYEINRYYLIVFNTKNRKESYRFLFDVMYNLKKQYIKDASDDEKYHVVGNFTPIPANIIPERSLQFIHKDYNENWNKMMEYLMKHWDEFKMNDFTFEDYKKMAYLEDCGSCAIPDTVIKIKNLIDDRGIKIQSKCSDLFKKFIPIVE